MSRTVLLSEVKEVAAKFPDWIAEIRGMFAEAGLPAGGEGALPALAQRLGDDTAFRRQMEGCLGALCAVEAEVSLLELLGVLVVAAAGPEGAARLAEAAGAEEQAALRSVFHFVIESRRRRSEVSPADVTRAVEPQALEEQPVAIRATEERLEAVAMREEPARRVALDGSGMLARALALAADEEAAEGRELGREEAAARNAVGEESVPREAVGEWAADRREKAWVGRAAALQEPVPLRGRRVESLRPVADVAIAEEDDGGVGTPRRWGMWTAVTCGILLGFGVGAFAHFEHRAAPVVSRAVPVAGEGAGSGVAPRRAKSVEELQAEIAAMDAVVNLTPGGEAGAAKPGEGRAGVSDRGMSRSVGRQDPVFAGRGREDGPGSSARGAGGMSALPAVGPVGAGSSPVDKPAPLVTSVAKPVSAKGAAMVTGSPLQPGAVAPMPEVITGSAGVMAGNLVSSPAPAYPVAASSAGIQGEVVVEAVVGRDGEVVDTRVVSGPPMLRAAALDAVQRWRYRPYEVDGKTIEVATTARLEFRLER